MPSDAKLSIQIDHREPAYQVMSYLSQRNYVGTSVTQLADEIRYAISERSWRYGESGCECQVV